MKRFTDLISECLPKITEVFPWDIADRLQPPSPLMILDVREPHEFNAMHIAGSLNIPRGILESACDYGYEETVSDLAAARNREIIVVCRSGNRSVLAAFTMQLMGYRNVVSMKTGLRGWNDYELPLVDSSGMMVPVDRADEFFTSRVRADQLEPGK